jgi:hypothetical protein
MGRFITANLPASGKPKTVVLDSALVTSQQRPDPQESTYARAGWNVAGGRLQHNGVTGAMFADLRVYPLKGYGVSAMTNIGAAPLGSAAVNDLMAILEAMNNKWSELFA